MIILLLRHERDQFNGDEHLSKYCFGRPRSGILLIRFFGNSWSFHWTFALFVLRTRQSMLSNDGVNLHRKLHEQELPFGKKPRGHTAPWARTGGGMVRNGKITGNQSNHLMDPPTPRNKGRHNRQNEVGHTIHETEKPSRPTPAAKIRGARSCVISDPMISLNFSTASLTYFMTSVLPASPLPVFGVLIPSCKVL